MTSLQNAARAVRRSGVQKCAILFIYLGPDASARLMQRLSAREIEAISREIAMLGEVPAEVVADVVHEFREAVEHGTLDVHGGMEYATQVLEEALGAAEAHRRVERIKEQLAKTGLQELRNASPEAIVAALRGEHPQTIALILAQLESDLAAEVVALMDPELAAEALWRVGSLQAVAPTYLSVIEASLAHKTDFSTGAGTRHVGGPETVATLLNLAGTSLEKQVLDNLSRVDEPTANVIRGLMFVFDDLRLLDKRAVQTLVSGVDLHDFALALKTASADLKAHLTAGLSQRGRETLEDELQMLGPQKRRDVEAAQKRMIERARDLESRGEIIIPGRDANGMDAMIQ